MWPLTSIGHISNTLIVFVLSPRSIIVHMHVLTLTRLFLSNMNISSLEMKPSPFVSNTSKQNFFFSSKSPRRNTDKPLTHSSRLTYPSLSWSNALKTEIKVYAWWPKVFFNHSFLVINSISDWERSYGRQEDTLAVPIFIFVSCLREGRFLVFHQERKKTRKMLSCSDLSCQIGR